MMQRHLTPPPAMRGFAAVMALFILMVLSALGAYMLSFSNVQQVSSAQDVQGSRAYWAARAGLEWAIAEVLATAPVPPATLPLATCPTGTAPSTIEGFSMTITCSATSYTEAGATRVLLRLQSVARTPGLSVGGVGYIERSVSATLEQ